MEKNMILKECSSLIQRTVTDRNGQSQVIESFEVVLSDGIDTILAETSKAVTVQFKQEETKPAINCIYAVSVRMNVVNYEKDGKQNRFFKATLIDAHAL